MPVPEVVSLSERIPPLKRRPRIATATSLFTGTGLAKVLRPLKALQLALFVSLALWGAPALAKPKVHTVYSGQRLGSIAKRYNVSVDELCKANGISPKAPIHPGQKLIIPGTDDGTGPDKSSKSSSAKSKSSDDKKASDSPTKPSGKAHIHIVQKGHTLSAIAGRYAVTVSALCYANDLPRNASLSVGQKIIVPHKTDKGGEYARKQRDRGDFSDKGEEQSEDKQDTKGEPGKKSWEPYMKPAWRKGYIKIRRYGRYWEGYVIGPKNEVLGHASNKINFVLGAKDDGPRIDPKLIRLIASVSDAFGGREIRIVSGYRTKSFVAASQHKVGKALDFSIPGIPNEALRDYLRTLDNVGVGYYPNSSFVHLDVRGYNSYWIDYAGPGEAPRKGPRKSSGAKKDKSKPKDDEADESEDDDSADEGAADEGSEEDNDAPDHGDEHDHDHDPADEDASQAEN